MSHHACSSSVDEHERLELLLQQHFQIPGFRNGQRDAVTATLKGQDSIIILPTGAGKSLTFQLPPFTRPHAFTVVISPLLALAKDQVEQALERGIDARIWNSEVVETQKSAVIRELCNSEVEMKLLYVTPESLKQPRLRDALKEAYDLGTLLSFAVDEAHCVSQWGHDFRPSYLELSTLKQDFPRVPIACLTASCTARVQSSILEILGLKNVSVVKASFNRPNIRYDVLYKDLIADGSETAITQDIIRFIKSHPGQSGIIYARLRTTCDYIGKALEMEDVDAAVYHAGKDARQRNRVHADWSSGAIQVVIATVAFGMGVDKPDVRWVIHYNAPSSMEGFYQESGRAGRDGQPCTSVVYVSHSDLEGMAKLERGNRSGSVIEVQNLLMSALCRRKKLLAFFGESRAACNAHAGEEACDFCGAPDAVASTLRQLNKAQEKKSIAASFRARYAESSDALEGATNPSEGPSKPALTWSTAKEDELGRGALTPAAAAATAAPAAAAVLPEALTSVRPDANQLGQSRSSHLIRPSLKCMPAAKRGLEPDVTSCQELKDSELDAQVESESGASVPSAGTTSAPSLALSGGQHLQHHVSGLSRPLIRRRATDSVKHVQYGQVSGFKRPSGATEHEPGVADVTGQTCAPDEVERGDRDAGPGGSEQEDGKHAEDEENVPPQLGLTAAPRMISFGLKKAARSSRRSFEPPLRALPEEQQ